MWYGAHMANSNITDADIALFRRANFKAAKLMWYHGANEVAWLRDSGCQFFVVRLRDLMELRRPDGSLPPWEEWADVTVQDINRFVALGIFNFQWGCETNDAGKFGSFGAWNYRFYAIRAFPRVRESIPPQVRLGLVPLTHATTANAENWRNVLKVPLDAAERAEPWAMGRSGSLVDWHDVVCVDSYWQWPRQITRDDLGGSAAFYHIWSEGKPIWVVEWASSDTDLNPRPTEPEIEQAMVDEYPIWLAWAQSQPYIEAAFVWIVGGTQDWSGFRVTGRVADAMSLAMRPIRQRVIR